MSSIRYTLQPGEFISFVADRFGFGSLDPIAEHPDNQEVIQLRGGVFWLREGDTITIPEGKAGKKNLAPGRGHVVKVKQLPDTLLLIVEVGFRLQDPDAVGDITKTTNRWKAINGPLPVEGATAKFSQGGAARHTSTTDRRGRLVVPLLEDGTWTLQLDPHDDERSKGPARAAPAGGHKLDKEFTGKPTKFFDAEYQPLTISLTVAGGKVTGARVTVPTPKERPVPGVVFWTGVDGGKSKQALHVDWKPDFLRRLSARAKPGEWVVRPVQRKRRAAIDLIMLHQTTGDSIGSALGTFLGPNEDSGAHFLLDLDGHLVRMADDDCHTQHGGGYGKVRTPEFEGPNVNERAIGIENVHKEVTDHLDPARAAFTDAQYKTLAELIKDLRKAYGVPLRKVIGHQDATPKARCPGPHFDWPRLEKAGAAMAPHALDATEHDTMFGGLFAGDAGRKRRLSFGDEEAGAAGNFQIMRKGQVIAEKLRQRPIECIHRALYAIGYMPRHFITQGGKRINHDDGKFGTSLAFCLSQFVRHFATGSRIRSDQSTAYLEIALGKTGRYNKVALDFDLAVLLRGAELAALAEPREIQEQISVD
ncbi:N-acetylmuramoyl-L-alanine amidase [Nannocystis pusilla]|uniref:N-acetylmuramoyl-L-alanine amidase n=1 Tax=Nannocystis pusilla TaxID=889268 RepID=UPI003BF4452C